MNLFNLKIRIFFIWHSYWLEHVCNTKILPPSKRILLQNSYFTKILKIDKVLTDKHKLLMIIAKRYNQKLCNMKAISVRRLASLRNIINTIENDKSYNNEEWLKSYYEEIWSLWCSLPYYSHKEIKIWSSFANGYSSWKIIIQSTTLKRTQLILANWKTH